MALVKYGRDQSNLSINGIVIEEFGDTDPAVTIEDIDVRATLKRGVGRTSLRLDSATRPKRMTVNLMPGSDVVSQLLALEKTGADMTATFSITGGNEKVAMFDGVITNRGSMGRVGRTSVSDESFILEFADSEEF